MKMESFCRQVRKEGGIILRRFKTEGSNTASIPGVKMADDGIGGHVPATTVVVYQKRNGHICQEKF